MLSLFKKKKNADIIPNIANINYHILNFAGIFLGLVVIVLPTTLYMMKNIENEIQRPIKTIIENPNYYYGQHKTTPFHLDTQSPDTLIKYVDKKHIQFIMPQQEVYVTKSKTKTNILDSLSLPTLSLYNYSSNIKIDNKDVADYSKFDTQHFNQELDKIRQEKNITIDVYLK